MIIRILKNDIAPMKSLARDLIQLRNQHLARQQSTLFVLPHSATAQTSAIKDDCRYIRDASIPSVLHTLQQSCTDTDYVFISDELISHNMIEALQKLEVTQFDLTTTQLHSTISPLRRMIIRQLRVFGDIPQDFPIRLDYIPETDKTTEGLKIEFHNSCICQETVELIKTIQTLSNRSPIKIKQTCHDPNSVYILGTDHIQSLLYLLGFINQHEMMQALRKEFHFAYFDEKEAQAQLGLHEMQIRQRLTATLIHSLDPSFDQTDEQIETLSKKIHLLEQKILSFHRTIDTGKIDLVECNKQSSSKKESTFNLAPTKADLSKKREKTLQSHLALKEAKKNLLALDSSLDYVQPYDCRKEQLRPYFEENCSMKEMVICLNTYIENIERFIKNFNKLRSLQPNQKIQILNECSPKLLNAIDSFTTYLKRFDTQKLTPELSTQLSFIRSTISWLDALREEFFAHIALLEHSASQAQSEITQLQCKQQLLNAQTTLANAQAALKSPEYQQLEVDLAHAKHLRRFYANRQAEQITISSILLTQEGHLLLAFQLVEPKQQRQLRDAIYARAEVWNRKDMNQKEAIKFEDIFVNRKKVFDDTNVCNTFIINKKYFHQIFNLSMQDIEELVTHTMEQWIQSKKQLSVTPALTFHPDGTFNLTEADKTYTFGTREGMNPIDELNDYLALQKAQLPSKITKLAKRLIEPKLKEAIQLKNARQHQSPLRLHS